VLKGTNMDDIIESRIAECISQAQRYEKWLNILKIPNFFLVGIGSLLAFLGGAAVVSEKFGEYAGYMALIGGALTGVHGWYGCESHQQKCRTIEARYSAFKLKYEVLKNKKCKADEREIMFSSLEDSYTEFIETIDAKPWI
jgi:hypothetical protein